LPTVLKCDDSFETFMFWQMADDESSGGSISLADAILMLDGSTNDIDRIADYEQMFSQRFTEADFDFMTVLNSANPPPPCIENWYSRPKRTFDWTRSVTRF